MATISLFSAKGSPGVTTTTLGVTLAWADAVAGRSALAVDADPIGGDVASGILRGTVPTGCGVLPLATARGMGPSEAVASASVHLRRDGSAGVIPGVPDSTRAAALTLAWDVLSQAQTDLGGGGVDLLVDCGRLDAGASLAPWVVDTDLAVLVVRPRLTDVTAAHRFVTMLTSVRADDGRSAGTVGQLGLVVVEVRSAYRATEVADVLGLPLLAAVPFDFDGASVYSDGTAPPRGFTRSSYARALHGLAARLGSEVGLRPQAGKGPGASSGRSSQHHLQQVRS